MTILERRKWLNEIENLNNEYEKVGKSNSYQKRLNNLLSRLANSGEALIMMLKEVKCNDVDALNLVNAIRDKLVHLGEIKWITKFAMLAPNADIMALTRAICNANAKDDELIDFVRKVPNAKIGIIARELADRKSLSGLQRLKKTLGFSEEHKKFKHSIGVYIDYIKIEYNGEFGN